MDFEEWWDMNGELYRRPTSDERYLFEAGQQSKQAEIDELQKRIDDALDHAVNHGGYDDLTHIINILKGELK